MSIHYLYKVLINQGFYEIIKIKDKKAESQEKGKIDKLFTIEQPKQIPIFKKNSFLEYAYFAMKIVNFLKIQNPNICFGLATGRQKAKTYLVLVTSWLQ